MPWDKDYYWQACRRKSWNRAYSGHGADGPGDDLLAYGLSGDKLDKWMNAHTEQDSRRRKRARKTI